MAKRKTPPGRQKALFDERQDHLAATGRPAKPPRSPPSRPAWSGKNDGTPGCLRTRGRVAENLADQQDPFLCGGCRGTEYRELPKDKNWPIRGRRICTRCHPA